MPAAIGRSRVDTPRKCRGREGRGIFIPSPARVWGDSGSNRHAMSYRPISTKNGKPGAPLASTTPRRVLPLLTRIVRLGRASGDGSGREEGEGGGGPMDPWAGISRVPSILPPILFDGTAQLGSAMQEIRHCFSQFAIARLYWRRREVLKRRRGVFEQGKEDRASSVHIFPFCCVVSLSRPVCLSQRALQNFNLLALSSSVPLLAFPNNKTAPLTARNRS